MAFLPSSSGQELTLEGLVDDSGAGLFTHKNYTERMPSILIMIWKKKKKKSNNWIHSDLDSFWHKEENDREYCRPFCKEWETDDLMLIAMNQVPWEAHPEFL